MGQNNDPREHGDLQGNQGGNLSPNPKEHTRLRQPEEGFARARNKPEAEGLVSGTSDNKGDTFDRAPAPDSRKSRDANRGGPGG